jgi:chromate transporter
MSSSEIPDPLPASAPSARSLSPTELFVAFSRMALTGFGGVMPFAYRTIVERERWITAQEFAAQLAVAQALPGPTICNLSLMIGWRFGGIRGALASLAGMLGGPIAIVMTLGAAYRHWGYLTQVHAVLIGMGAVAAGLLLSTAVKMGLSVFAKRTTSAWSTLSVIAMATAFVGVGLLRYPLIAVVLVVAPATVFLAWKIRA